MSQVEQRSARPDRDHGRAIERRKTSAAQYREIELKFQLPLPSSALLEATALFAGVAVTRRSAYELF